MGEPRPNDPPRRRGRLAVLLSFGVPVVAVAAWCLLMRTEPQSILAPIAGPWAGHLYGHADCTLAHTMPTATWIAVGAGIVGAALAVKRPGPAFLTPALIALWSLVWSAMGLLSVVNTLS